MEQRLIATSLPRSASVKIDGGQGALGASRRCEDYVDGMISRREGGCVEGNGELGTGVTADHGGRDTGIANPEVLDDVDWRKRRSGEVCDEAVRTLSSRVPWRGVFFEEVIESGAVIVCEACSTEAVKPGWGGDRCSHGREGGIGGLGG